jgi:3-methyladenine DNA glycosylase AlkD
MNAQILIKRLKAAGNSVEAARMAGYHKAARTYLGVRVPVITGLARQFWQESGGEGLMACCRGLWKTDIHEARILTGKLFDVRKLHETEGVWRLISEVKEDFDAWAIADHLEKGAQQCLRADPERLDEIEEVWLSHSNFWVRRAALVYTLYLGKKGRDPERPLRWAAAMVDDRQWFIQKAIGWWLRELSKHNPVRVTAFSEIYGSRMKPFARKEALKYVPQSA